MPHNPLGDIEWRGDRKVVTPDVGQGREPVRYLNITDEFADVHVHGVPCFLTVDDARIGCAKYGWHARSLVRLTLSELIPSIAPVRAVVIDEQGDVRNYAMLGEEDVAG